MTSRRRILCRYTELSDQAKLNRGTQQQAPARVLGVRSGAAKADEQVQWTCESDERRSGARPSATRGRTRRDFVVPGWIIRSNFEVGDSAWWPGARHGCDRRVLRYPYGLYRGCPC